jgi:hypothetical protein
MPNPNPVVIVVRSYLKACSQLKCTRSTANANQFIALTLLTLHHLQMHLKVHFQFDLILPQPLNEYTLSRLYEFTDIKLHKNHPLHSFPSIPETCSQALLYFQRFFLFNSFFPTRDTTLVDDRITSFLNTDPAHSELTKEEVDKMTDIDLSQSHFGYDYEEFPSVLSEIGQYPCRTLDLSECQWEWRVTYFQPTFADALLTFLAHHQTLRELKVHHSPSLIPAIGRYLSQPPVQLEKLDLANNEISRGAMEQLLMTLANYPPRQLKSLTLHEARTYPQFDPNPLSLQSFYHLVRLIHHAPSSFQHFVFINSHLTPPYKQLLRAEWRRAKRDEKGLDLGDDLPKAQHDPEEKSVLPLVPPSNPENTARTLSSFREAVLKLCIQWQETIVQRVNRLGGNTQELHDLYRKILHLNSCVIALKYCHQDDDTLLMLEADAVCSRLEQYEQYNLLSRTTSSVSTLITPLINSLKDILKNVFTEPTPETTTLQPSQQNVIPQTFTRTQRNRQPIPVTTSTIRANLPLPVPSETSQITSQTSNSSFRLKAKDIFDKYPHAPYDYTLKPWLREIINKIKNYLDNPKSLKDDSRLVVHLYYLYYNHPKQETPRPSQATLNLFDDITQLMQEYRTGVRTPYIYFNDPTYMSFFTAFLMSVDSDAPLKEPLPREAGPSQNNALPAPASSANPPAALPSRLQENSRYQLPVIEVIAAAVHHEKSRQELYDQFQYHLYSRLEVHWYAAKILVFTNWIKMDKSHDSFFTITNILKILVSCSFLLQLSGNALGQVFSSEKIQNWLEDIEPSDHYLHAAELFHKSLERVGLLHYFEKVVDYIKESLGLSNHHKLEQLTRLITSKKQLKKLAAVFRQVCEGPIAKLEPESVEHTAAFLVTRTVNYILDAKNDNPAQVQPSTLVYGVLQRICLSPHPQGEKVKILPLLGYPFPSTSHFAQQFLSLQGIVCQYEQKDFQIDFKVEQQGKNGALIQTNGTLYGYRRALQREVEQMRGGELNGAAVQCVAKDGKDNKELVITYFLESGNTDQILGQASLFILHYREFSCEELTDPSVAIESELDKMIKEELEKAKKRIDDLEARVTSLEDERSELKEGINTQAETIKELKKANIQLDGKVQVLQDHVDKMSSILATFSAAATETSSSGLAPGSGKSNDIPAAASTPTNALPLATGDNETITPVAVAERSLSTNPSAALVAASMKKGISLKNSQDKSEKGHGEKEEEENTSLTTQGRTPPPSPRDGTVLKPV